jgi:ADP-ribose pyrophosphatase
MDKPKNIFKGKLLNLCVKEVVLPNKYKTNIEYIKHPGAVLIVPILDDDSMILIRQFRPVINKYIWEFPAGTLEEKETPLICAKRELVEEVGYKANKLKKIAEIFPAPGYTTEKIIIYKATKLKKVKKKSMEDEVISLKRFKIKQIERFIKEGKILDAKTICAFFLINKI